MARTNNGAGSSVNAAGKGNAPKGAAAKSPHGVMTLAVDIGGTGIKAILLDEQDKPIGERHRTKTPQPATPKAVLAVIADLAKQSGPFDRVSVGFPGVVRDGVTKTAHNLDQQWVGFHLKAALGAKLSRPVRVCNDAGVQGYGVISGKGLELAITLGTGMGSALFIDGKLVPNLELAHHPFRGKKTYEEFLGKKAMEKLGKKKWNKKLAQAITQLDALFNYDHLYIGGGNVSQVEIELPRNVTKTSNIAGLYGGIALWRD